MIPHWSSMSDVERHNFGSAVAFLEGRLQDEGTVEWAIDLGPDRASERAAVLHVLSLRDREGLREPWRSVWALIEESWRNSVIRRSDSLGVYAIERRVRNGERSGSLITQIVELVRPYVEVKRRSDWYLGGRKPPRRPSQVSHLIWATVSSGDVLDPSRIALQTITEVDFLLELANELDATVNKGLDIGRRLGWKGGRDRYWIIGEVRRVYFVPEGSRPPNEHEPDEIHTGIAPSVKLLHEVVARLAHLDQEVAGRFIDGWRAVVSPIHKRLWSALARSVDIATATEVFRFLQECDSSEFWDIAHYPEIAELRSVRFSEMDVAQQSKLLNRLMKGPPRRQWSRNIERERVDRARVYWIARELQRVKISTQALPEREQDWLTNHLALFEDLRQMNRLDEGFLGMAKAQAVPPNPDDRFDLLEGEERLKDLEQALSTTERLWESDPAKRANDWMRQIGRTDLILIDLERAQQSGAAYPYVWDRFGWYDAPPQDANAEGERESVARARRVLRLLEDLPLHAATQAIEGITFWLSNWVVKTEGIADIGRTWTKLWPIAVDSTNARQEESDSADLDTIIRSNAQGEPQELDTLNSPAGRLVGVFLNLCPRLEPDIRPFDKDQDLRAMRDMLIQAEGRSGLIARYRLIEALPWFFLADEDWTQEQLILPLLADSDEAVTLWRAVARRAHPADVLRIIGEPMANRASDLRLGRNARQMLAFNVVVQSLHAFRLNQEPVVSNLIVQQMLRSLDDEVRAYAAGTVGRFVRENSAQEVDPPDPNLTAEELFRSSARPFLEQVWPQERSLSTPGVARAFADLPVSSGEELAEAVDTIERFLVPFECWSIGDYGLREVSDAESPLSEIDSREKAEALLTLMDRTIGSTEGGVVPIDLGRALEHLRSVVPRIIDRPEFRRLAALTRR